MNQIKTRRWTPEGEVEEVWESDLFDEDLGEDLDEDLLFE